MRINIVQEINIILLFSINLIDKSLSYLFTIMSDAKNETCVESYKFHHIDISKCKECKEFSCEDACFRGIYEVINKNSEPRCVVIEDREDRCIKCHICTTACTKKAILID